MADNTHEHSHFVRPYIRKNLIEYAREYINNIVKKVFFYAILHIN
jgi:hypothetical protein